MGGVQRKLAAAWLALVAGVVVLAGVVAERSLREQQIARLERALTGEARLVERLAARAGASEAPEAPVGAGEPTIVPARRPALEVVADRAAEAVGARVTFIAPDGTVVADSQVPTARLPEVENHAGRPEVRAALAGRVGSDRRRSATVALPFFYVAVPVAGGAGGAVRLAVDTAFVERDVAALRARLALAGALALALAALGAWVASARLVRPLRELRGALAALVAGDLRRRFAWGSRDELGDIARAVNDLAEQLRARVHELTADNERLQAVLQGMVEGVLVLDAAGHVALANRRLRELFGVWGPVEGRPALEVIRHGEVEAALRRAREGEAPVPCELTVGGRVLQMHAVRFPARGALLGTVAVFHDVTGLRRLEEMRKEFVANVSHELRTPLTAIRGFAETLEQPELGDEARREYLAVIRRHAERLAALIEDLLELSRIEGRRQPVERVPVDVAALARGLLRDLEPRLAESRLEASVAGPQTLEALGDRRALEQVLTNLLDNALKYTPEGGRVVVRLAAEDGSVRLEVEDTGIGIPEADRERVFERFYRVDKARSRALGGTGLGLSIVKHLVQAMGGEVAVASREGKGTTFTVRLPRAPDA